MYVYTNNFLCIIMLAVVQFLYLDQSNFFSGKKDVTQKNTLADVLVRSDRHQKKWGIKMYMLANASLLTHLY
jgi:hypothetical protein